MRVHYKLTLIGVTYNKRRRKKVCIQWTKRYPGNPALIIPHWAATRKTVLRLVPEITALDDAHLELTFL